MGIKPLTCPLWHFYFYNPSLDETFSVSLTLSLSLSHTNAYSLSISACIPLGQCLSDKILLRNLNLATMSTGLKNTSAPPSLNEKSPKNGIKFQIGLVVQLVLVRLHFLISEYLLLRANSELEQPKSISQLKLLREEVKMFVLTHWFNCMSYFCCMQY